MSSKLTGWTPPIGGAIGPWVLTAPEIDVRGGCVTGADVNTELIWVCGGKVKGAVPTPRNGCWGGGTVGVVLKGMVCTKPPPVLAARIAAWIISWA